MSEHLPECAAPQDFWRTCICDALRACEQRVRTEGLYEINNGTEEMFKAGYAAALDAAEAAVEAALNTGLSSSSDNALYFYELDEDDPTLGYNVTFPKGSLIAVIRALKGER